ncbi:MAG: hypothetical protein NT085_04410 [candidate division SR1 bacterium]|nr:hypothetical protein [candidate division SR1 bacterium]
MYDIKNLGAEQLGLYYEVTYKKLNDIKIEIIEDIAELLGTTPQIEYTTYIEQKEFEIYCTPYLQDIQKEKKEMFLILSQQEQTIQEEIRTRQKQMLKNIGITTPSLRVQMIKQATEGGQFPMFNDMITYIELLKTGEENKRPKNKKIYASPKLIEFFENLGITLLTILAKNEGPMPN